MNPGEISAHKTGRASFAIYDTEIIFIDNIVTVRTPLVAKWYDSVDFS